MRNYYWVCGPTWRSWFCYPLTIARVRQDTAASLGSKKTKLELADSPPVERRWTPDVDCLCIEDLKKYMRRYDDAND